MPMSPNNDREGTAWEGHGEPTAAHFLVNFGSIENNRRKTENGSVSRFLSMSSKHGQITMTIYY